MNNKKLFLSAITLGIATFAGTMAYAANSLYNESTLGDVGNVGYLYNTSSGKIKNVGYISDYLFNEGEIETTGNVGSYFHNGYNAKIGQVGNVADYLFNRGQIEKVGNVTDYISNSGSIKVLGDAKNRLNNYGYIGTAGNVSDRLYNSGQIEEIGTVGELFNSNFASIGQVKDVLGDLNNYGFIKEVGNTSGEFSNYGTIDQAGNAFRFLKNYGTIKSMGDITEYLENNGIANVENIYGNNTLSDQPAVLNTQSGTLTINGYVNNGIYNKGIITTVNDVYGMTENYGDIQNAGIIFGDFLNQAEKAKAKVSDIEGNVFNNGKLDVKNRIIGSVENNNQIVANSVTGNVVNRGSMIIAQTNINSETGAIDSVISGNLVVWKHQGSLDATITGSNGAVKDDFIIIGDMVHGTISNGCANLATTGGMLSLDHLNITDKNLTLGDLTFAFAKQTLTFSNGKFLNLSIPNLTFIKKDSGWIYFVNENGVQINISENTNLTMIQNEDDSYNIISSDLSQGAENLESENITPFKKLLMHVPLAEMYEIFGDVENHGLLIAGKITGNIENNFTLVAEKVTGNLLGKSNSTTTVVELDGNIAIEPNAVLNLGKVSGKLENNGNVQLNGVNNTDFNFGNLTNNGNIYFVNLGRTLTLGDADGNGNFHMDVNFATNQKDFLNITGDVNGKHTLYITDLSGSAGSVTPSIEIVAIGGSMNGEFIIPDFSVGTLLATGSYDAATKKVNVFLTNKPNATMATALTTAASLTLAWNSELDTLLKRMGELRFNANTGNAQGDIWMRTYGQQINADSGNDVTPFREYLYGIDVGVDKAFSGNPDSTVFIGAFMGYGHSDRDFKRNSSDGETDGYYGGFYATWMNKDSWYADAVIKAEWFDNLFDVHDSYRNKAKGDYETWAAGFSLEAGKQIKFNEGWYIEPQAQVAWMHVGDADYTTSGTNRFDVEVNDSNVWQFRLGMIAGREITTATGIVQPYFKLSGVEQTSDGGNVKASGNDWNPNFDGTRVETGIGVNWQINTTNQIHFDYEYAYAEDYTKPWGINLGYRYSF